MQGFLGRMSNNFLTHFPSDLRVIFPFWWWPAGGQTVPNFFFTTSLEMKSSCVSLLHKLRSVLWLTAAVKGHCMQLGSAASGALKPVWPQSESSSHVLVVVLSVWRPLCFSELVGLAAPRRPPIITRHSPPL